MRTIKIQVIGIFIFLISLYSVQGQRYEKNIYRSFEKSRVAELDISNKYGNIEIKDTRGDSITIDAKITVRNANERKALETISKIDIVIKQEGRSLDVQTVIAQTLNNSGNLSIDYIISIPKDRHLNITNKYGNVMLNDLEGNGSFDISYGNLSTGKLKAPDISLVLSYGNADIKSVNDIKAVIKYSNLYLDTAKDINLTSSYSNLEAEKVEFLRINSKYDGVRVNEIDKVAADSRYTKYTINLLNENCVMNSGYGSIRVGKVDLSFNYIEIKGSYCNISLGLTGVDYSIDVSCDYCDVKYPTNQLTGDLSIDNHSVRLKGTMGTGSPDGKLIINSRYGDINLN